MVAQIHASLLNYSCVLPLTYSVHASLVLCPSALQGVSEQRGPVTHDLKLILAVLLSNIIAIRLGLGRL